MPKTEDFDMKHFILKMALNKAFEAGRKHGVSESRGPVAGYYPDFERWYRDEMKLDKPESS